MELPDVYKVVFVVDRKDLDYQTMTEFNAFKKDSVDVTDNTQSLVRQLTDHEVGTDDDSKIRQCRFATLRWKFVNAQFSLNENLMRNSDSTKLHLAQKWC
jgi:hypothetical protein